MAGYCDYNRCLRNWYDYNEHILGINTYLYFWSQRRKKYKNIIINFKGLSNAAILRNFLKY